MPSDYATSSRRQFLRASTAGAVSLSFPLTSTAATASMDKPVRMGLLADLHQDIMHDGLQRMKAFVAAMDRHEPDAVVQLGDFAYPKKENSEVIELFNQSHKTSLHVIGNHDTDSGHTKQQCIDVWKMPDRYYRTKVGGLTVLVLDGNETGSPTHGGGYPAYIAAGQLKWLGEQLESHAGPVVVFSHQPLAGPSAIDNAKDVQALLAKFADKVLIAINGHSHIDDLVEVDGIRYLHINSASYYWVGGNYRHKSYDESIHGEFPWIEYTCPYEKPLFTLMTVDPVQQKLSIEACKSDWVGDTPQELGIVGRVELEHGEEIVPIIRERSLPFSV